MQNAILIQQLDSLDLNTAYNAALQLSEKVALEPLRLVMIADRLAKVQRTADVINLYQHWLARCKTPVNYIINFNLGVMLGSLNQIDGAEKAYRDAIEQHPIFAQAWFNLGTLMERQRKVKEALDIWQDMIDKRMVTPDGTRDLYVMCENNLGRLKEEIKQYQEAEVHLLRSLQADPQQPKVIQHWVHLRQKQCAWPVFTPIEGLSLGDMIKFTSPLAMLSVSGDPGLQLATSMHFAYTRVNYRTPQLAPAQGYQHDKIRVGFLSSDFCMHAVSLLTVELFELFDRERFELYGFCWSNDDGSDVRARIIKAMNHFVRIKDMDDLSAARTILSHEIDVLVDLHGLTSGARPNIVAAKPAPVQMTYLGFPGPTGLPGIDYVFADRFLIPDHEKAYYSEEPLYLPNVYQSSDRKRAVGALPTRAQCGLPDDKFVFCSFNNNYKFNEETFDCWLRILQRVPDSVLWLLADNQWAQQNLTDYARRHDIDPARLIFAPRVAPADYLARYTAADVFLDSYPFNAGTTANDALFMGLPVLTRSGRTFAARMAGALLTALKLPELITYNLQDYEERAVQLAQQPALLADLKRRLIEGRQTSPLFDMPQFVKDFEEALASKVLRAGAT